MTPSYTLAELADRFGLTPIGDATVRLSGLCALKPGEAGKLAYLGTAAHRAALSSTAASAVIVSQRDVPSLGTAALVASDPGLAFARIAKLFDRSREFEPGISSQALVDPTARIGMGCRIEAGALVGAGAVIGEGSRIGPGCIVQAGAVLGVATWLVAKVIVDGSVRAGARLQVQPGAVIGARGFGNVRLPDGSWEEMPQLGGVVIGDDVEIGANTTIDRGALGDTVIGNGVKLDNQIQIAHNCVVGAHTVMAACTGIAGSTTIGSRCMIGGAAGIAGHLHICDDVVILGMAMITSHITEAGVYGSGLPLQPAREWRKTVARVRRLARLEERTRRLEAALRLTTEAPPADNSESDA